ncbi:hypothetical protein RN001_002533 [Aquatica leii]|uniref:Uncharacterized protein n=1 Tax=Aquatica leii TaxID=1421715 RepID=A0AAN7SK76_9COLE|nr:hypothetical protein RN001_002533 [Aquatica leii]
MAPGLRSDDAVTAFLKCEEFSNITKVIISRETQKLRDEISTLKDEVRDLKISNDNLFQHISEKFSKQSNNKDTNHGSKKSTYASKLRHDNLLETVSSPPPSTNLSSSTQSLSQGPLNTIVKVTENADSDGFQLAKKKNTRQRNIVCGSLTSTCVLKVATKWMHYNVYPLQPNTSSDNIIEYLKSKNINDAKCEKLQARRPNEYSSFKITVSETDTKVVTSSDTWPTDVKINPV